MYITSTGLIVRNLINQQILSCNNTLVGGSSRLKKLSKVLAVVAITANISPNAFRPVTQLSNCFTNDMEVKVIYSLGKLALNHSANHVVKAYVVNNNISTVSNVPVTLNVTGVNTVWFFQRRHRRRHRS